MSTTVSAQIIVGTTPTQIIAKIPQGQIFILSNRDAANSVYVGNSTVTTTSGTEVKFGQSFSYGEIELPPETEIYACCASGTVRVDLFAVIGN